MEAVELWALKYKILTSIRHPWTFLRALKFNRMHRSGAKKYHQVTLKERNIPILINTQDVGISRDLMIWREREVQATKSLLSLIKPGQTILDLGANIGYYVVLEASVIGPTGRILAMEPAPENLELLRKNIELNNCADFVSADHGAVGDETGTATLHLVNKSNLHCIHKDADQKPDLTFTGSVEVPMYRVDDYLVKKNVDPASVDVVRMDIEGFEVEAFAGMTELIKNAKDLLVFVEIHPSLIKHRLGEQAYKDFIMQLDQAGFEIMNAARSLTSRLDEDIPIKQVRELIPEDLAIELILRKSA